MSYRKMWWDVINLCADMWSDVLISVCKIRSCFTSSAATLRRLFINIDDAMATDTIYRKFLRSCLVTL
jgi:hypothetical protein